MLTEACKGQCEPDRAAVKSR